MVEKEPPIKLFTWKHGIIMFMAMLAGTGLAMYVIYERKGYLGKADLVIAFVSMLFGTAIFTGIAYYGNRPEKKE